MRDNQTTPADPLAYKNRTKSSVNGDVTVTVAVPTIAEAQAIYGVELASKHIQPVWVEVKNDSADTLLVFAFGAGSRLLFPVRGGLRFPHGFG